MSSVLPDSLVEGRFQLLEVIGEGGMATVYRAYDQRLRRPLAIKILSPAFTGRPSLRQRFLHEAMTMCALEDRRVVRVVDSGEDGDRAYIIMELVEGGSLLDRVRDYGPLPPRMAARVTLDIAQALQYAHDKKVIHRDIKPHNILLTRDGEIRITDFGIAQVQHDGHQMTRTGAVMGTWGFMAPEQKVDARSVEKTADVYSVGATLWSLLRAETPPELFMADSEPSMMEHIPEELGAIIRRATRYRREERYQSMREMADSINALMPLLPEDPPDAIPLVPPRSSTGAETDVATLIQLATVPQPVSEPPSDDRRRGLAAPGTARRPGSVSDIGDRSLVSPSGSSTRKLANTPSAPAAAETIAAGGTMAPGYTMVPGDLERAGVRIDGAGASTGGVTVAYEPPPSAPVASASPGFLQRWGLLIGLAVAAGGLLSVGMGWALTNLGTTAPAASGGQAEAGLPVDGALPGAAAIAAAPSAQPVPGAVAGEVAGAMTVAGSAPTQAGAVPAGGSTPSEGAAAPPTPTAAGAAAVADGTTAPAATGSPPTADGGTTAPPVPPDGAAADLAPAGTTAPAGGSSPPPEASAPEPFLEVAPVGDATVGQELSFSARALPGWSVTLYYRASGTTTWTPKVMTGKDGTYSVPFRIDDSMSGGVEYFVEASRAGTSTRLKDGSHASPHRFSVAPAP